MKEQKLFKFSALIYALGAIFSAYLVYDHYQLVNGENFKSICTTSAYFDCDAVNSSKYAVFLGVPLATWGLCYYLFGIFVSGMGAASRYAIREAAFALAPNAIFSVAVSIALFSISVTRINALCLFCISTYVINLISALSVLLASKSQLKAPLVEFGKLDRSRLSFFLGTGVLGSIIVITATSQLKSTIPFDPMAFESRMAAEVTAGLDAGHSPRLGASNSTAKIRLVEFSDFECPFCGRQARELSRVIRNYGDEVQLVFKNFPLDMSCNPEMKFQLHHSACVSARAAWCAHQSGKFDAMSAMLFSSQKSLSINNMSKWASELGINQATFEKCITSSEARAAVDADIRLAQAVGVKVTPTFFINGRRYEGLVTMETIEWLLKTQNKK